MGSERPELTIMVTRPREQGLVLSQLLREQGFRVIQQPLIEIEVLEELAPEQRRLLFDLERYDDVIFVSSNAARHGLDHIEAVWPQLPVHPRWHAIGPATARALAKREIGRAHV